MTACIIFTDMDGTLLDHRTYEPGVALPVLRRLQRQGVPVCLASSKTRAEMAEYCRELEIDHPFIFENGGGIYIPPGYFGQPPEGVIALGIRRERLIRELAFAAARENIRVRAFHELTAEELCAESGLPVGAAARALDREFDEPFQLEGVVDPAPLQRALESAGLRVMRGGRYWHVTGVVDKGVAMEALLARYRERSPDLAAAAIGDSANDLGMLKRADIAYAVQRPDRSYDPELVAGVPGLRRADGIGPAGWVLAVEGILSELGL